MKKAVLLLMLTACNAGAIDSPDEAEQSCDGNCLVVTRDNPVLTEGTLISSGEEAFGTVEGGTWEYRNFRFEVSGTTPSDSLGSSPPGYRSLEAWPRESGQWTPTGSDVEDVPWEIHGARVGVNGLDVRVTKLDAEFGQSAAASTTNVRLALEIPLVPVQVVRVLPPHTRQEDAWRTAPFTPEWGSLMLDDYWQADIVSGGATNLYRGTWQVRAGGDGLTGWGYEPDAIFEQCGVQFRQIGYFEVEATELQWDLDIANGCLAIDRILVGLYNEAVNVAGVDRRFPTIMGVPRLDGPSPCNGEEVRPGAGESSPMVAFVQQYLDRDNRHVLSHELGHVLRLNDLFTSPDGIPHKDCSGPDDHNLMCDHAPAEGRKLEPNQCDIVRARARNLFNACITTEGCFGWRPEDQ